jgi:transposase
MQLECVLILKLLGQVFEYDAQAKKMPALIRLEHHQKNSAPIMEQLRTYITKLLIERKVEPNSEFGKAIKYMLRHWDKLTRFLTVAGAPIDNNLVEGALKIAIRNRKASMFYRTEYSAYIGGVLTSLIYTCHLANENPQTYLTALQQYKIKVATTPELFMPWNYQATIASYESNASQEEPWSQQAHPVVA